MTSSTEPLRGPLQQRREGVVLLVHAHPGARQDAIGGLHDGRLRVRVTAPPEDGRANERIVEVVARAFSLRRNEVEVVLGATSRRKELLLLGLTMEDASARLAAVVAGGP